MDRTKSLTIISVSVVFVVGLVAVSALYFSSKKQLTVNTATTNASREANSGGNSMPVTQDVVSTKPEAVLSLSVSSQTKLVVSATCSVPANYTCDLWAYDATTNNPELLLKFSEATISSSQEGKALYTWDLKDKDANKKYKSFMGKAYDSNGVHITDSTNTEL